MKKKIICVKNGKEMDIERELPKMCVRDEKHMRKHFGIFEDGKLVACLGVYPYLAAVANIFLSFWRLVTL